MKAPETLAAFQARTAGFIYDSLPHGCGLETNAKLSLKVGPDGKMEPFMGNTVVFPLPEPVKREAAWIQERLYQVCGPVLAEPLEASTFHITLHDLLSGPPSRELRERINCIGDSALRCVEEIAGKRETICIHTTTLFNMVNTSMVLGIAPDDEESCKRLMSCYEMLQEVIPLDYPLTPHVTVAYFRPGLISEKSVEKLRKAVDEAGRREPVFAALSGESIQYQLFADMNHYWTESTTDRARGQTQKSGAPTKVWG